MKVTNVERVLVDVPFTPRQQQITTQSVSTVYNWSSLSCARLPRIPGMLVGVRPLSTIPIPELAMIVLNVCLGRVLPNA